MFICISLLLSLCCALWVIESRKRGTSLSESNALGAPSRSLGPLRIDVLPEEEKLLLHLRVECPDSWHEGPDARIVRSCCVFERVVAHLTDIVGPGVPVQGGCTAVPKRGWRTKKRISSFSRSR